MKNAAVAAVLALTVACIVLALVEAVSPFVPHAFYGVSFDMKTGRVFRVFPEELPPGTRIVAGDRVRESAAGDPLRGYALKTPRAGDVIHVATASGVVTVHAAPHTYILRDAVYQAFHALTTVAVLAFAALLMVRRPGAMAFAYWVSALFSVGGGDLDYAIAWFPLGVRFTIATLFEGLVFSGIALIPFALRFPSGKLPPRVRWLDWAAWAALVVSLPVESAVYVGFYAGRLSLFDSQLAAGAVPPLIAVAIFVAKYVRAARLDRPRLAWATLGFSAAAGCAR